MSGRDSGGRQTGKTESTAPATQERSIGPEAGGGRAVRTLRHRDYRLLWGAEFVSILGTQMQRTAIIWQVYHLTADPLQLGLLGLFRFAPILLFGLLGGVIADRRDRRRTLLATQVVLLSASALLALLSAREAVTMPIIYAVTFFAAMVSAVAGPTRQALIPALVPRRDLAGAMSLNVLAQQVASVSGPALAGVLIARAGVTFVYALDTLSFLAVIAALRALHARPRGVAATVGGLAAAWEGLRFLRDSPILLGVMIVDFLATFFGASMVLMPIFAERILDIGPGGLGLLMAAPAAGAVVGGVVATALPTPARPGAAVLVAVAVYGACITIFGLSSVLWVSLVALAASGAADAVSMAFRHTIRNLVTPDPLRGRIAAAHSTFAMGGPQLGELEAGLAAAAIGAGPSVAVGGIATMLTAMIVAHRVPAIAAYRTDDAPAPSASASSAAPSSAGSSGTSEGRAAP